jgi:hypothetical protein
MVTATTNKWQRAFLWLAPSAITLGLLAFAPLAASDPRVPAALWWIGALGVVLAWFSYVSTPRRVVVNGAELALERPIGSISVRISHIHRIDARVWNSGFVIVRAKRRRVLLLRRMPNLFAIVAAITQRNPTVAVVGRVPSAAYQPLDSPARHRLEAVHPHGGTCWAAGQLERCAGSVRRSLG